MRCNNCVTKHVTIKLLTFPEGVELATAFKHGFVGHLCPSSQFFGAKDSQKQGNKQNKS